MNIVFRRICDVNLVKNRINIEDDFSDGFRGLSYLDRHTRMAI
jgi:hypothetical protein